MRKSFIHISDIHFRNNWEENQGQVLNAFLTDIDKQVKNVGVENIYFIFSGDIVIAGEKAELYEMFLHDITARLEKIGITKSKRIVVPGNHDVSRLYVEKNFVDHNGVVTQELPETQFNDYITRNLGPLVDKFDNYRKFEQQFAEFGIGNLIGGNGWIIDENIGIYCLNTALTSSGGYNNILDKGKLAVDTRTIHKWVTDTNCQTRILVMHHPLDWLCDWAKKEIKNIVLNHFDLVVSGHEHEQEVFNAIHDNGDHIYCIAPPLFTEKKSLLGYSIINVENNKEFKIVYRQWTGKGVFVKGVNFSNNEDGEVLIANRFTQTNDEGTVKTEKYYHVEFILKKRLDDALRIFSSQPLLWIDPKVSKVPMNAPEHKVKDEHDVSLDEIIADSSNILFKAPPQFGLTSLACHLTIEVWRKQEKLWLYIDCKDLKVQNVEKAVKDELQNLNSKIEDVECILLDSWQFEGKDVNRVLSKLKIQYPSKRFMVFQTVEDRHFLEEDTEGGWDGFLKLYLSTLPKNQIRKVVTDYNQMLHIGDDDVVLKKVIDDIEALNIHRTPMNCKTLLKAFENNFDESPVNRAELIHSILYLLFQDDKIPTYKSKPDLKDCEFVLGRFCEEIVRKTMPLIFSREMFIKKLNDYCTERVIELEVSVVFDILHTNNIIIGKGSEFTFRFTYWIYYFSAIQMRYDDTFKEFIFDKKHFASFPEIIEFYTGTDRNRKDALDIIQKDLNSIIEGVDKKVGLPANMNPYKLMTWNPSEEILKKMNAELGQEVNNSKLPDVVKDSYDDKRYNSRKAYNQSIKNIFADFSVPFLWEASIAASRALRNSDYVDPETKRALLKQICASWKQISKVLFAISPILAERGAASFDGAGFVLIDDWGEDPQRRWVSVLCEISSNIVGWFKRDIYSPKMGPLLFDSLENETDELMRHQIALLIISEMPRGWKNAIAKYIDTLHKNSYYLFDINNALKVQYHFGTLLTSDIRNVESLIKAALSKHNFGTMSRANRIPDSMLGKKGE